MQLAKSLKIKIFGAIAVSLLLSISAYGRPKQETTSIKIDGSSTVYPITQKVIEEWKTTQNKNLDIELEISGTGGGFRQFCQGEIDINNASRPIQSEEMKLCQENGVYYIELPVAFDALTVVVNEQNNWVESLTTEELKKIWEPSAEGKITNWNQIRNNFPDQPLNLFGADVDSGTYDYFTEAIVGEAGASRQDYVASEDDNLTVEGVSQDPNALGYFGLSYYEANSDGLKTVAIDNGEGAIFPSRETVEKADYQPLARPLFIYLNIKSVQENAVLRQFIDFYIDNASTLVEVVGYIPLTEESYQINKVTFHRGEVGTVFGGRSEFDLTLPELQRRQAEFTVE